MEARERLTVTKCEGRADIRGNACSCTHARTQSHMRTRDRDSMELPSSWHRSCYGTSRPPLATPTSSHSACSSTKVSLSLSLSLCSPLPSPRHWRQWSSPSESLPILIPQGGCGSLRPGGSVRWGGHDDRDCRNQGRVLAPLQAANHPAHRGPPHGLGAHAGESGSPTPSLGSGGSLPPCAYPRVCLPRGGAGAVQRARPVSLSACALRPAGESSVTPACWPSDRARAA